MYRSNCGRSSTTESVSSQHQCVSLSHKQKSYNAVLCQLKAYAKEREELIVTNSYLSTTKEVARPDAKDVRT